MKFTHAIALIVTLLLTCSIVHSQDNGDDYTQDDLSALFIGFNLGQQLPAGDLSDIYGANSTINLDLNYRFNNSDFGITVNADYLFGRNVSLDVLDGLRTQSGFLIGTDGLPADVFLRQRGYNIKAGLTWSKDLWSGRDHFGPLIRLSGGLLSHWIRIQDDRVTADQLKQDYDFGYDRKRIGFSLNQFLGIQYLSMNKRINFTLGIDLTQAITESVRPFNWDTREYTEGTQLDLLQGVRIGWILPFYFNERTEEIYY